MNENEREIEIKRRWENEKQIRWTGSSKRETEGDAGNA